MEKNNDHTNFDTKAVENKSVSSMLRIMQDTQCIKKIPLRRLSKVFLRYYLRFCFPAFLPTGLFWRFAKVSCCVAFCAGLLGVLRSGKTTLS